MLLNFTTDPGLEYTIHFQHQHQWKQCSHPQRAPPNSNSWYYYLLTSPTGSCSCSLQSSGSIFTCLPGCHSNVIYLAIAPTTKSLIISRILGATFSWHGWGTEYYRLPGNYSLRSCEMEALLLIQTDKLNSRQEADGRTLQNCEKFPMGSQDAQRSWNMPWLPFWFALPPEAHLACYTSFWPMFSVQNNGRLGMIQTASASPSKMMRYTGLSWYFHHDLCQVCSITDSL